MHRVVCSGASVRPISLRVKRARLPFRLLLLEPPILPWCMVPTYGTQPQQCGKHYFLPFLWEGVPEGVALLGCEGSQARCTLLWAGWCM
jgi:hypothetical protein